MKAIDLTHIITEDMPVYPGTEPPKLTPANSYERDGFKETLLSLYTHTRQRTFSPMGGRWTSSRRSSSSARRWS